MCSVWDSFWSPWQGRQQLVLMRCRAQRLIPVLLLKGLKRTAQLRTTSHIVGKTAAPFLFWTYGELAQPPSQKHNSRDCVSKVGTVHKPIWICFFQSFSFPTIYTIISNKSLNQFAYLITWKTNMDKMNVTVTELFTLKCTVKQFWNVKID